MLVDRRTKSLILHVRPQKMSAIQQVFPKHHRVIQYQGHNLLQVPHNLEVVKVLRNMGIKAHSPIRYHYNWPRPARFAEVFPHQIETADFLTLNPRCFVLNEMGTSKTASTLWAIDYLMQIGYVKKVLIASTLSTMEPVWLNEAFDVCMHRSAVVLHADRDKRIELLNRGADLNIINHGGLKVIANEIIARKDIDLVVVDEASVYRNAGTDAYECLQAVAKGRKLWLLSGAPCPNAPTDAWALARLVNPNLVPAHFSQWKRKTMSQVSTYKWVPRPGSHEMAYNALQPGIRFKKADCISLPPLTVLPRHCTLTKEQTDAYAQMKAHLVLHMGAQNVNAVNAADAISKLRQILCGAVKKDDQYIVIPHGPRLDVLKESIEQASAKVIVVVPFKGIARVLREELQDWHDKKKDGKRVEIVNGDVKPADRNRIFQDFRDDPTLTEIVCHPAVMAHGLTLTQADTLVYYAPIYSNDLAQQVNDRINRPGQTLKMTIVRISASPLERSIYALLDTRAQTQENMLALFKKEMAT